MAEGQINIKKTMFVLKDESEYFTDEVFKRMYTNPQHTYTTDDKWFYKDRPLTYTQFENRQKKREEYDKAQLDKTKYKTYLKEPYASLGCDHIVQFTDPKGPTDIIYAKWDYDYTYEYPELKESNGIFQYDSSVPNKRTKIEGSGHYTIFDKNSDNYICELDKYYNSKVPVETEYIENKDEIKQAKEQLRGLM